MNISPLTTVITVQLLFNQLKLNFAPPSSHHTRASAGSQMWKLFAEDFYKYHKMGLFGSFTDLKNKQTVHCASA